MKLASYPQKLNGWQRVWVIFSVLCLVVIATVVVNDFPDSNPHSAYRIRQLHDNFDATRTDSRFVEWVKEEQIKFVVTWLIAWLGIIGVAYAGGIIVAWALKGFRQNQGDSR